MKHHHRRRTEQVFPHTRYGWYLWYAEQFNQHGQPYAAQLAMWYYLLHIAFDLNPQQEEPTDE